MSGNIVRERIKTLKNNGVKFTPSLERIARDFMRHITNLELKLAPGVKIDFESKSTLEILDDLGLIKSMVESLKVAPIASVQDFEEEIIDFAEAILAETVKLFEEVLNKPIVE